MFNIALILIFILSVSMVATSFQDNQTNIKGRQRILAITDDSFLSTVTSLYNDRVAINKTSLKITYVSTNNAAQMANLATNKSLNLAFDEFWVVSQKISDTSSNLSAVIHNLLSYDLPLFLWTNQLSSLQPADQAKLGITSCTSDSHSFDNSLLGFNYANSSSLSALLNQSLPSIQSITGSISIADCSFSQSFYPIIDLNEINSSSVNPGPIPVVFQPSYKSNIVIASFKVDTEDVSSTPITTSSTTTTESTTSANTETTTNTSDQINMIQDTLGLHPKVQSANQISLYSLLSTLTYGINFGWTGTVTLSSFATGTSPSTTGTGSQTGTATNPSSIGILQTGFQFPKIDAKLATNVAVGTSILGLLGLLILFLRRYWIAILGLFVSIFAVFKVPSRKISVMDVYHNETRQNIIDILNFRKGQGETVRNLSRELQIPLPTLLWHLQILEEFELIVKEKVKREVVVISMDYIEEFDLDLKVFEMTFKSDKAKIFYDYLLNLDVEQIFTITSVVNHTSWSARTVIRYISKLLELQIIEQNPIGKGYRIKSSYYSKLRELSEIN